MLSNAMGTTLLNEILRGEITSFSEETKKSIELHRPDLEKQLYALIASNIEGLLAEEVFDGSLLYHSMHLAAWLQLKEAGLLVLKLLDTSVEKIDYFLGEYFLAEDLPYILASTIMDAKVLMPWISNVNVESDIRVACMIALSYAWADNRSQRSDLVEFYQNMLENILSGQELDEEFVNHLVNCCCDVGPEDFIEAIKKLYGLRLVDETFCSMQDVLNERAKEIEICKNRLKSEMQGKNIYREKQQRGEDESEQAIDRMLKHLANVDKKNDQEFGKLGLLRVERNERCYCGSQKKYKKCCLTQQKFLDPFKELNINMSNITSRALPSYVYLREISFEEAIELEELIEKAFKEPIETKKRCEYYISKYEHIPVAYYALHLVHMHLRCFNDAIKTLEITVKKFPEYLRSRTDYAEYLIKREETDLAFELMGKARTLYELYPDRKEFDIVDWVCFSYVMGLCHAKFGSFEQSTMYLELINKLAPKSYEKQELEACIKKTIRQQSFQEMDIRAL